jgi:2-phosphoglycerate kinase
MVVVVIGGSASMGKTTLAGGIAERLDLDRVVHVDDLTSRVAASAGRSFGQETRSSSVTSRSTASWPGAPYDHA